MIRLLRPSAKFKISYLKAIKEPDAQKLFRRFEILGEKEKENFFDYIKKINSYKKGKNLAPGYVPESVYWLVDDKTYIGRVSIRHFLTDKLKKEGGHIGYDIRPSKRRLGYGTLILKLALKKAKKLNIKTVLLTCTKDNIASLSIIKKNGGQLIDEFVFNKLNGEKSKKLRFRIEL